jgi:hypothetical protein
MWLWSDALAAAQAVAPVGPDRAAPPATADAVAPAAAGVQPATEIVFHGPTSACTPIRVIPGDRLELPPAAHGQVPGVSAGLPQIQH